ncbi:MAG TPA: class I SAM-dependent methyltransferase [Pyrinomonadaceae bacterium]|nr:class I SAM-dependent methyltransferase [Pyrinomonadaceae bacterium]
MKPTDTGHLYDRIAAWWDDQQERSTAGLDFVRAAIKLTASKGNALDVGCGSGGRIVAALLDAGFQVTGIDVSEAMVEKASKRHAGSRFILADICEWQPREQYDAIIAWDSIFHVPYSEQRRVVLRLCEALAQGGVILFTAGGVDGEITGQMRGLDFYYSSLAEEEYLRTLKETGCKCVLMQRDQYPEEHVVFIGVKG